MRSFRKSLAIHYVIAGPKERYLQMFKGKEQAATPVVEWASSVLRKDDRIVWFLKNYRKDSSIWNDENKLALEHMMSMADQIKGIEKLKFEAAWDFTKGMEALKEAEAAGMCSLTAGKRLLNAQGKKIVDVGDGYAWWDLEVPSSDLEAAAMGHCGNTASAHPDDTILSLRHEKKVGKQSLYEPHLTFILNKGILGEMKGRANEKPKDKYHKYIVELLKSPVIEHIWGGGYEPYRNFEFEDLTEAEQKELTKLKPDINLAGSLSGMKSRAANRSEKHFNEFQQHGYIIQKLQKKYKTDNLTQADLKKELQPLVEQPFSDASIFYPEEDAAWIIKKIKDDKFTDHFLTWKSGKELGERGYSDGIKAAALSRTKDQKIIEDLAKDSGENAHKIRIPAINKLKDDKVVTEIFYTANNLYVQRAALAKSKDPEVLESAWKKGTREEEPLQRVVVSKLKDKPEKLYKLIEKYPYILGLDLEQDVMEVLSDEQIADLIVKNKEIFHPESVAKHLTDKEALKKIITSGNHLYQDSSHYILTAILRGGMEESIKKFALNDTNNLFLRIRAANALKDDAVFEKLWKEERVVDPKRSHLRKVLLRESTTWSKKLLADEAGPEFLMVLAKHIEEFTPDEMRAFLHRLNSTHIEKEKDVKTLVPLIEKAAADALRPKILEEALEALHHFDLQENTNSAGKTSEKLLQEKGRPLALWTPLLKHLDYDEQVKPWLKKGDLGGDAIERAKAIEYQYGKFLTKEESEELSQLLADSGGAG